MNVGELVAALLEQDQTLPVGYYDTDYGFQEIEKPLWVKTTGQDDGEREVLVL